MLETKLEYHILPKDLGHLGLAHIRIMLGQSWDTGILVLTYTFVVMQCKDVGSDSMCLRHALPMGTLVWNVSQILYHNV